MSSDNKQKKPLRSKRKYYKAPASASGLRGNGDGNGNSKRPRSGVHWRRKVSGQIERGSQVIVLSCENGKEAQSAAEMMNWMYELMGDDDGARVAAADSSNASTSISNELQNELASLRGSVDAETCHRINSLKRIAVPKSGSAAIRVVDVEKLDAVQLVTGVVMDARKCGKRKSRYTVRMRPLQNTCYAKLDDLKAMAAKMFEAYFVDGVAAAAAGKSYGIRYEKIGWSNELVREVVVDTLASLVPAGFHVNLSAPDTTILVLSMGTIVGLSLIPGFTSMRKCNIRVVQDDSAAAATSSST